MVYKKSIDDLVSGDIDGAFLHTASNRCAWAYSQLYDSIMRDPLIPSWMREETFSRRRSTAVMSALGSAAEAHGIPYDFRKLAGNGQRKLIMRVGRFTLIQEPMHQTFASPLPSDYKVEMARCQGVLQQLELDLGDMPSRMIDFSGNFLGVLLHGAASTHFTREGKALGAFMLGIPDANYVNWIRRYDLHDLAMFGYGMSSKTPPHAEEVPVVQNDKVRVRARARLNVALEN